MKMIVYSILFVLFLFFLASADTLNVKSQYATIQSAIDAATDGDVVLVENGLYYENINFKGKKITVASHYLKDQNESHIENTIIDGSQHTNPDSGSVVYFVSGEDTNSVLCGFTITGGRGTKWILQNNTYIEGGGIWIKDSGAKVIHNIVSHNTLQGTALLLWGAGITAYGNYNDYIIIHDNVFKNNTIISGKCWGAGAGLGTKGTLLFENNIVIYNNIEASETGIGGGIIIDGNLGYNGITILNRNIIANNKVQGNIISNTRGGGIAVNYANSTMTNNIIYKNTCEGYGGGLHLNHQTNIGRLSKTTFINNTVTQNEAIDAGGGLYIKGSYIYLVIINSIFWNNNTSISGWVDNLIVAYSDIQGGWEGEENKDEDPLFVDTLSFDFKLSDSSPCIGAGIESIQIGDTWYHCPNCCYSGEQRPNPEDSDPDMGACENPLGVPDDTDIEARDYHFPLTFKLNQNHPNPFNPKTVISYQLPVSSEVDLSIYTLLGQKVATLVNKNQPAGSYEVGFNRRNLSSGVYLYRIQAGEWQDVKKMILLK